MIITELLPQLHNLSRNEKLKLIKFLVQDLGTEGVETATLEGQEIDSENVLLAQLAGTWTDEDEVEFLENTKFSGDMNITIKPELEKLALSLVERGKYENIEQVIEAVLILLEKESQDYEDWIEEVRPKIEVGLAQLERGEKVDGDVVIAQLQKKLNRKRLSE